MARRRKRTKWGLFKPATHGWIAEIVTFETITGAAEAARKLKNAFKRANIRGKLTILRATQYAANRARAAAKRKDLTPEVRRRLLKIAQIYEAASDWMQRQYAKAKGG